MRDGLGRAEAGDGGQHALLLGIVDAPRRHHVLHGEIGNGLGGATGRVSRRTSALSRRSLKFDGHAGLLHVRIEQHAQRHAAGIAPWSEASAPARRRRCGRRKARWRRCRRPARRGRRSPRSSPARASRKPAPRRAGPRASPAASDLAMRLASSSRPPARMLSELSMASTVISPVRDRRRRRGADIGMRRRPAPAARPARCASRTAPGSAGAGA